MMKYYQKKFNKIHILMDACIIVFSYLLAYYLRFFVLNNRFDFFRMGVNEKWYSLNVYSGKLILIVPLYLCFYYFLNLYAPIKTKFTLTKVFQTVLANVLGMALLLCALYLQRENDISRQFLLLFFVINVILSVGSRMLYSYYLKIIRKK